MKRRALLQVLAGALVAPFSRLRLHARTAPALTSVEALTSVQAVTSAAALSPAQLATLEALAEVALPSALGAEGRAAVVRRFAAWLDGYREGADMGHGYGSSNLRRPSGPSPALRYPPQFAALDAAAASAAQAQAGAPAGAPGTSFAMLDAAARRAIVQRALDEPERVTRLPGSPTGDHLVADFLGFYFNSPDAWDLCYQARIGTDRCRSLDGSDQPPAAIGGH